MTYNNYKLRMFLYTVNENNVCDVKAEFITDIVNDKISQLSAKIDYIATMADIDVSEVET